jgi:hypothetical protein
MRRGLQAAALAAVFSAGGLFVGATPASAGPNCSPLGCSSSVNDTPVTATAFFNWCGGGSTGTMTTSGQTTCSSGGVAQKTYGLTTNGGHTPYSQDWDSLRIDAGWCYKVKFVVDLAPDFTRTYDRRGTSAAWVKVSDNADAHIQGQSSSTCP